jgi:hypothetical protein
MAYTYNIDKNTADSHQSTPWAIVGFYPYAFPDTFYAKKNKNLSSNEDALKVNPLIVANDILSIQVSTGKGSPNHTAEIVLSSGNINYSSALNPGDNCAIWIHDDISYFSDIYKLLVNTNNRNASLSETSANYGSSGLKFLGKIESVRQILSTSVTGVKSVQYAVSARGFTEFETTIYYNPYLREAPDTNADKETFYQRISNSFDKLVRSFKEGGYPIDFLMEFYINSFIGKGPSRDFRSHKTPAGAQIDSSGNDALYIPRNISALLGQAALQSKSLSSYADILNTIIGVQKYSQQGYLPDITSKTQSSTQKRTTIPLAGNLLALPDIGTSVSLISLIQSNMNAAINEIYFTLRLNEKNLIMPTMVLRQKPFSTKKSGLNPDKMTMFSEIPRWKISADRAIKFYNIGTNNAARSNFIQIFGAMNASAASTEDVQVQQLLDGNYTFDRYDIVRSGSKNMLYQTNADAFRVNNASSSSNSFSDGKHVFLTNIRYWKELVTDWTVNLHLKLNGSMTVSGISEPICPGDNLEFDGKLFHIEGVQHLYRVEADGSKTFETNIALSHGLLLNEEYLSTASQSREDLTEDIYPGITNEFKYEDVNYASSPANPKSNKSES